METLLILRLIFGLESTYLVGHYAVAFVHLLDATGGPLRSWVTFLKSAFPFITRNILKLLTFEVVDHFDLIYDVTSRIAYFICLRIKVTGISATAGRLIVRVNGVRCLPCEVAIEFLNF